MSVQSLNCRPERHNIANRQAFEKNAQDSLVCLFPRIIHLYRSWGVARRRIVSSGDYLPHQCADWVFLCLGILEKGETRQGVKSNPCATASPTMARWTQSTLRICPVAELGSLESTGSKQDGQMADCCNRA